MRIRISSGSYCSADASSGSRPGAEGRPQREDSGCHAEGAVNKDVLGRDLPAPEEPRAQLHCGQCRGNYENQYPKRCAPQPFLPLASGVRGHCTPEAEINEATTNPTPMRANMPPKNLMNSGFEKKDLE